MIIPSKHSGYQAGIRLYPGGGGDGSGGQGDATGNADPGSNPSTQADSAGSFGGGRGGYFGNNAGGLFGPVNTGGLSGYVAYGGNKNSGFDGGGYGGDINNNNTVVKKTQPTAGTSTIDPNNPALKAIGGSPYNQSGQYYNSLLQQGYVGNDIRNALTTQGRPISDSNYEALVQNAGMTSPTGRPMAGSDQFTQPVYNSQYQNYANPYNFSNVSDYGTASRFYQPPQQYNPFSYQQPRSMGLANPDSYVDPYSGRATGLANPTNYANQRFQQQQQYNPFGYQQQQYNPYQQQQYSPFSYQQQYNPYDSYPQTYQQQPVVPTSSGPTSPIVGRSSGFRGTPNVMRRAEGGIAGILKK